MQLLNEQVWIILAGCTALISVNLLAVDEQWWMFTLKTAKASNNELSVPTVTPVIQKNSHSFFYSWL